MKLNFENAIIFGHYVVKILTLWLLWNLTLKTTKIFWRFEVQILGIACWPIVIDKMVIYQTDQQNVCSKDGNSVFIILSETLIL